MSKIRSILISLATLVAVATGAHANDGDMAEVSVLPGWKTQNGTYMSALRIKLSPGWKTYWRAPGDAGIPPQFNWEGSENLGRVTFHWPRPTVYMINGMRSIGYYDELILPIEVTPQNAGKPVHLEARIDMGVCQKICVPMSARVTAELIGEGARNAAITRALDAQPDTAHKASVGRVACKVEPNDDGLRLTAQINMPPLGGDEVMVFELPDKSIWISESSNRRDGQYFSATSDMVPPSGAPFALDRSDVRITVLGQNRAVEIQGCPAG